MAILELGDDAIGQEVGPALAALIEEAMRTGERVEWTSPGFVHTAETRALMDETWARIEAGEFWDRQS